MKSKLLHTFLLAPLYNESQTQCCWGQVRMCAWPAALTLPSIDTDIDTSQIMRSAPRPWSAIHVRLSGPVDTELKTLVFASVFIVDCGHSVPITEWREPNPFMREMHFSYSPPMSCIICLSQWTWWLKIKGLLLVSIFQLLFVVKI